MGYNSQFVEIWEGRPFVHVWQGRVQRDLRVNSGKNKQSDNSPGGGAFSPHVRMVPCILHLWAMLLYLAMTLGLVVNGRSAATLLMEIPAGLLYLCIPTLFFYFTAKLDFEEIPSKQVKRRRNSLYLHPMNCFCPLCTMNLRCAQSSKHSRGGVKYKAFLFPPRQQTPDQRDALMVIENWNSLEVNRLLLVLAGDVEVNPGPITGDTPLSLSDLGDVYEEVYSVRAKWINFGLALKLPSEALDTIDNSKYCEKPGDCLREMLKARLMKSKLTWRMIIIALRKQTVGENKLADQLEREYGPQKPSAEGNGQTQQKPKLSDTLNAPGSTTSTLGKRSQVEDGHDQPSSDAKHLKLETPMTTVQSEESHNSSEDQMAESSEKDLILKKPTVGETKSAAQVEGVYHCYSEKTTDEVRAGLEVGGDAACGTDIHFLAKREDTVLSVGTHLQPVKHAVWKARSLWKEIGRALGISDDTISTIHYTDDGECLHKVLSEWIHSGKATIHDLLQALADKTVERNDIKNEIHVLKGASEESRETGFSSKETKDLVLGEELSLDVSPCTVNEATYNGTGALAVTYNPQETDPAKQDEERESYQTFLDEVTKVKHPNIVQVLEVDSTHDFPVLVIEKLEPLTHYCVSDNPAISEENQQSFLINIANAILSFQDPYQERVKIKPDAIFVQRSNGKVLAKYCPMFGFSYYQQAQDLRKCCLKWLDDICKLLHLRGNVRQYSDLPDNHILKHLIEHKWLEKKSCSKNIFSVKYELENLYSTPLTQDDVEALKKLLKERDSSLALEGISSEVLTTDSSGKVHATLEKVQQSLRQRGLDDLADNLKEKLDEGEQQRYVERLQDLMTDENTINLRYLKLFLVGPPGVGKTTTLERLRKEIENILSAGDKKKISSTMLANCVQVLAFVSGNEADSEWLSSSNLDEEAQILFGYMCSTVDQVSESPDEEEGDSNPPEPTPKVKVAAQSKEEPKKKSGASKTAYSSDRHAQPSRQVDEPRYARVDDFFHRLKTLIKSGDYSAFLRLVKESTLLNISDIGGQPGFLEMLPALSKGPALYLLFFDLCKALNQLYKIPFSRDDTSITPYDSEHTVEGILSQLLSAIASVHCTSEPTPSGIERATQFKEKFEKFQSVTPVTTVIGTHKDQLERDVAEQIRLRNEALEEVTDKDQLEREVAEQIRLKNEALKKVTSIFSEIVANPDEKNTFFAVDNYQGTEQSDIAPIRAHLHRLFSTHFRDASLPVRPAYLLFSIILRKEFCITTMEDCLEIGKRLGMHLKEEVEFSLWYLHHCVGALMYYPKVPDDEDGWFREHIICSPQVVFDSISQLILASLRTLHSEGTCLEYEREELIKKGQFSLQAIEKYCMNEKIAKMMENRELIPVRKLIQLLKSVNLLSLITRSGDKKNAKEPTYLLPAILPCATKEELTQPPQPDDNNPAPILITFERGYVPTGVFCGLITQLVSRGPGGILGLTWELEEKCVKRNQISFNVDSVHLVTLLSHERCYEVRVARRDDSHSLHELCTYVLSVILSVLKELYKHLITKIAFERPCEQHQCRDLNNLCILTEGSSLRFICGSNEPVKLNQQQLVWIGKHARLRDCIKLEALKFAKTKTLEGLSFHWYRVGEDTELVTLAKPNVLKIQSVGEEDFGQYKCEIKKEGIPYITTYLGLLKQSEVQSAPRSNRPRPLTVDGGDSSSKSPHHQHDPPTGGITILKIDPHLRHVKNAVFKARSQWKAIGRALGLTYDTIDSIHDQDDVECLHKVLSIWMQSGGSTIHGLLDALEDITVARHDIAHMIRSLKDEDRTRVGL